MQNTGGRIKLKFSVLENSMFYFFSDGNLQLQEGILLFLFRVLSMLRDLMR